MKKRFNTKRALIRKIEDQRGTIARLVDANNEQQKEISELRELLKSIDLIADDFDRWTRGMKSETEVMQQMTRRYRQDHGLFVPETGTADDPFDAWDGK